eukprot:362018-Chlamydomonas_euryale.AAC.21
MSHDKRIALNATNLNRMQNLPTRHARAHARTGAHVCAAHGVQGNERDRQPRLAQRTSSPRGDGRRCVQVAV